MFESVVPETFVARSRRILYETLPVSLAVHALAIGGVLASSVWTVAFPPQSPRLVTAYNLTRLPDPPPPPQPPPTPQPAVAARRPQVLPRSAPPATVVLAPTVIPDTIPQVAEAPPELPPPPAPVPVAVEAKASAGEANATGEVGGKRWGLKGGIYFAEDGRIHVERKEKLPLKVLEQEFPRYPDSARKDRLDDVLVVRYVIGTNGRVTDVSIIEHAKNPLFEAPTLDVIRRWRFRPMMVNGKAIEVVHEVEIAYQFFLR